MKGDNLSLETDLIRNIKDKYEVILLDIEGTTTPITFVTETLFPFAKSGVKHYLLQNWEAEEAQNDIKNLRNQAKEDAGNDIADVPTIPEEREKDEIVNAVVKNVEWQMKQDRKITALKQLQGHIWKAGYESGELKAVLYDDVLDTMRSLKEMGKKLCIYSSGSVQAQKLLFKYTKTGDVTDILSGYYDTKLGGKREAQSYKNIAEDLKCEANKILFLTDVIEEADASTEAGMKACILLRPGNKEIPKDKLEKHTTIKTFEELLDNTEPPANKKQKVEQ